MRLHIEVLGLLHFIWGAMGVLAGLSLCVLAVGTDAALVDLGATSAGDQTAAWILAICGGALISAGTAMIIVGRGVRRLRRWARVAALILSVPNLVVIPFGTALGVYTVWVLLNDEARRQFGRPPRVSTPTAMLEPM